MENGSIPVAPIILFLFLAVGFLLFLGIAGLVIFLATRAVKRRSYDTNRGNEMRSLAGQMSFSFTPQADLASIPSFDGFELFEGYPLKVENHMTGAVTGCVVTVFDLVYRNVGGSGAGTTTSRQTMYSAGADGLELPEFYLRPNGLTERVLNTVSRVDIALARQPGFSSKTFLYGKDEPAIRRLFDGQISDFFEKNAHLCIFGRGDHIFFYQSRIATPCPLIQQNIMFLPSLLRLFLNAQQTGTPGS